MISTSLHASPVARPPIAFDVARTAADGAGSLQAFSTPFRLARGRNDLDAILQQTAGRTTFAPKAEMLRQGDFASDVLVIVDGLACTYQLLDDGRRQILGFSLPGDLIGFARAGDALPYAAAAITHVTVAILPQARMMRAAATSPSFALALTQAVIASHALSQHHLTNVGRRTARERVASLLLELFCRARAVSKGPPDQIAMPLTQEEVGDALGLTHFHVNRVLRALRKEGVVDFGHGVLRVCDVDRLANEAGVDVGAFAIAEAA